MIASAHQTRIFAFLKDVWRENRKSTERRKANVWSAGSFNARLLRTLAKVNPGKTLEKLSQHVDLSYGNDEKWPTKEDFQVQRDLFEN